MAELNRITLDPQVMGGKPCIRGMRVTVGTIVDLIASGATVEEILDDYPYLEREDIDAAVSYSPPMSGPSNLEIPMDQIEALCRKWRVRELALFGSVLRDDFGPDSDIDVLVSFEDDAPWSLWDLTTMQDEISALLGRPIDLVECEGLRNPFRRERILSTRRVVYVAGQG